MKIFKMICTVMFKLLVLLVAFVIVAGQSLVMDIYDVSSSVFISYVSISLVMLLFLFICFFIKRNRVCYIILLVSILGSFSIRSFNEEIVLSNKRDSCSGRGVWDSNQKICRSDCWRWTKEDGCFS